LTANVGDGGVVSVGKLLVKVYDGEDVDVALFVTFIVNEGGDE